MRNVRNNRMSSHHLSYRNPLLKSIVVIFSYVEIHVSQFMHTSHLLSSMALENFVSGIKDEKLYQYRITHLHPAAAIAKYIFH